MVKMVQIPIEPEPPPPPESIKPPTMEERHWMDDALHSATNDFTTIKNANDYDATTIVDGYSPFIRKLQTKEDLRAQLLRAKHHKSPLPPPNNHPLHIPTPKSQYHTSMLHNTTWKDYPSNEWIKNATGGWDIPSLDNTNFDLTADDDETICIHQPPRPPPAPNIEPHDGIPTINTAKLKESSTFMIQCDIGANRCVTDDNTIMENYTAIDPYPIGGVEKDEIAIVCTGKGDIPWYSKEGHKIMVECLYSADCDGTIISPTAVVKNNATLFQGYVIVSDCDNGTGHLKLLHRDGVSHSTFPMHQQNDLWYHRFNSSSKPLATVHRMNDACLSALWHGRFGCAGNSVMEVIHKHVKGIDRPLRRNPYYRCPSCMPNKMCKRSMKQKPRTAKHKSRPPPKIVENQTIKSEEHDLIQDDDIIDGNPGQHFHMDFGFVRGSEYKLKQELGPTITSIDGFNSYLIIVDHITRYT